MHTTARFIAAVALVWWAGDEIVRSVNPWCRVLGTVVLAGLVATVTLAMS